MTLHLNPDIEARLVELARSNGISVEVFLQRVVEEKSGTKNPQHVLSSEEWNKEFEKWADSFPDAPIIPDEALRRDHLYPDR